MMKNKQVNDKQSGSRKINLNNEVIYLLKTMELLQKPSTINYLLNIVTGSNIYAWKKSGHDQLETFGALAWCESVRLHRTIQIMVDMHLIEGVPKNLQSVRITPQGQRFLENPKPVEVYPDKVKLNGNDFSLLYFLKEIRSSFAEKEGQEENTILPLFTLERIAYLRPRDEKSLSNIPGMGKVRMKKLGTSILASIQKVVTKERDEKRKKQMRMVFSPSFQKTKELWLAGYSIQEIATIRGHRLATVHAYLEKLHFADEINMRPWIEKYIDSKQLYRGVEFFKQVPKATLNEAHEVLGLSYDVLRKCKMYLYEAPPVEQESAIAA